MIRRPHSLRALLTLPVVVLAVGGCTSLPDVGPFVEATGELRAAVVQAGATTETELRRADSGDADELEARADELKAQWATRVDAMNALVDYAGSLQAIVAAGDEGQNSAAALADSVTALAGTAGIAVPGGAAAVAVGTDAVKLVYREIALIRAAKSLDESLERSRQPVGRIVQIVAQDMQNLADIFEAGIELALGDLEEPHNVGFTFRDTLVSRRTELYSKLSGNPEARQRVELAAELREVDAQLAATNEWFGPYQAKRGALETRAATGSALLAAAQDAVAQWGTAYSNLVIAVKERRAVSTQSLTRTTADVRDLIKRIREL